MDVIEQLNKAIVVQSKLLYVEFQQKDLSRSPVQYTYNVEKFCEVFGIDAASGAPVLEALAAQGTGIRKLLSGKWEMVPNIIKRP